MAAALEDVAKGVTKGGVPTALAGAAAVLVAPVAVQVVSAGIRPLAKGLIKGAIVIGAGGKEFLAEAGERLSDLIAEAKGEIE
jgi:hypothetical protein